MAKLQDCQFIEVKIDGKTIAGSSEEKKYSKWMEGYAPAGLNTFLALTEPILTPFRCLFW
ncbi:MULTISPECIES: hypothetical protein [Enterobacteriaceae]|uniref:hypothetical protein n=1 Tax=Enterobacteriaceae TaxID=543 RepID=UPI0002E31906|nr:hypothetical protein [Enterobacter sp. Ag1]